MKRHRIFTGLILAAVSSFQMATAGADKLAGRVMGAGDALNGTCYENVFDGNLSTSLYADRQGEYSRPWVGLDLGAAHVINEIRFAPDRSSTLCSRLAIFQGANREDFLDAMPVAMVPANGMVAGNLNSIPVDVSRGFRYVRMVGAGGAQMNVAEIEFYGEAGTGDDTKFFQITNLPTIAFNTPDMAEIVAKDDKHPGSTIYVISDGGTTLLTDTECQMKGRGNGSWMMEKKPFQIKFDKKTQIFPDAPAKGKKWTLINNYGDKSLMRNRVAFDMSRKAGMAYTPYCRFVDVIYNGEYEGCYQLCDQIDVREGRVDITEMTPDDNAGDALTGGYLLEVDAYAQHETSWFTAVHNLPVTIKSPEDDEITTAQRNYIEKYFNQMVNAVYATNYTDPENGYRKYLDLDSFLRYFICNELNGNPDAYWSTYMYKERGDDRFHTGPVWDIDLGFNNEKSIYDIDNRPKFIYNYGSHAGDMHLFVRRIVENDSEARHRLSVIWSALRQDPDFCADYFNALIDNYAKELEQSQQLNFVRWPILDKKVHHNPVVYYTYSGEVEAVKSYITKRFARLDKMIGIVDVPEDFGGVGPVTEDEAASPAIYYRIDGTCAGDNPSMPGLYIVHRGTASEKVLVR